MRLRVLTGALLALLCLGPVASVSFAQEESRPTQEQPSPGVPFTETEQSKPWHYNWVGKTAMVALTVLFLAALFGGYVFRWLGVGRRTT